MIGKFGFAKDLTSAEVAALAKPKEFVDFPVGTHDLQIMAIAVGEPNEANPTWFPISYTLAIPEEGIKAAKKTITVKATGEDKEIDVVVNAKGNEVASLTHRVSIPQTTLFYNTSSGKKSNFMWVKTSAMLQALGFDHTDLQALAKNFADEATIQKQVGGILTVEAGHQGNYIRRIADGVFSVCAANGEPLDIKAEALKAGQEVIEGDEANSFASKELAEAAVMTYNIKYHNNNNFVSVLDIRRAENAAPAAGAAPEEAAVEADEADDQW